VVTVICAGSKSMPLLEKVIVQSALLSFCIESRNTTTSPLPIMAHKKLGRPGSKCSTREISPNSYGISLGDVSALYRAMVHRAWLGLADATALSIVSINAAEARLVWPERKSGGVAAIPERSAR
jgi:hypothetical protein